MDKYTPSEQTNMVVGAIGMAAVAFAAGLGLIAIGTGLVVPQRLQSAGRFDIAVGVGLVLYGAVVLWTRPSGVWFAFPLFLGYFLSGVALFRQSCVLQTPDYRDRDIGVSFLLWFTGTTAMIGLAGGREPFLLWFSPALLIGAVGGLVLLADVVKHLRGQRVYRRDIAGAAALVSAFVLFWIFYSQWFYIDSTVA